MDLKKINENKRRSYFVPLSDWCIFSSVSKNGAGDYLQVTEWTNGEGVDVEISDSDGNRLFKLTNGQMSALSKIWEKMDTSGSM